jgi:hypothetical protein
VAGTPRGRHRLDRPIARPAAITRSASVVVATVGTVLGLAAPSHGEPDSDGLQPASSPLQPVVLQPPADAPADLRATGDALAAAHRATAAALSAAGDECRGHLAA